MWNKSNPSELENDEIFTVSKALLRASGSYGADGMASENQVGLYHLLSAPSLLEYRWPGGKLSKCSQSSFNPFSSDAIQTEPEFKPNMLT